MKLTFTRTNITNTPYDNKHMRKILDNQISHMMTKSSGKMLGIDGFARESFVHTNPHFITNDLNEEFDCHYNLEWKDFCRNIKMRVDNFGLRSPDLVFFDPPYSLRQLKDHYDGIGKNLKLWQTHNMWGEGKDMLASTMQVGSRVVSFGWTSSGFGKKRGFEKVELHVFEQVAREDRYSLLVTVEEKVQHSLDDYTMDVESE